MVIDSAHQYYYYYYYYYTVVVMIIIIISLNPLTDSKRDHPTQVFYDSDEPGRSKSPSWGDN